jgi:hypothetical protein
MVNAKRRTAVPIPPGRSRSEFLGNLSAPVRVPNRTAVGQAGG